MEMHGLGFGQPLATSGGFSEFSHPHQELQDTSSFNCGNARFGVWAVPSHFQGGLLGWNFVNVFRFLPSVSLEVSFDVKT